jgi:hypothetical protein
MIFGRGLLLHKKSFRTNSPDISAMLTAPFVELQRLPAYREKIALELEVFSGAKHK